MTSSFVATVYNEEDTIDELIRSLFTQTVKPDEVIIVDGGSTDNTVSHLRKYKNKIKFFVKEGNRAVGRNAAVRTANGEIILSSDAGCVLDEQWVENITKPFRNSNIEVVAGYYKGLAKTVFQKCLVPYVFVMPNSVDVKTFLPASRTMAFRKVIWQKAGGFPENFSHNEDYVFAKRLSALGAKIVFARDAIVYWMPREDLWEAFSMFYRFAHGDIEARIIRPKVLILFLRYIFGFVFLLVSTTNTTLLLYLCIGLIFYLMWSIAKNYHYVKAWQAVFFLPILQLTADSAVILGSLHGLIDLFRLKLTRRKSGLYKRYN